MIQNVPKPDRGPPSRLNLHFTSYPTAIMALWEWSRQVIQYVPKPDTAPFWLEFAYNKPTLLPSFSTLFSQVFEATHKSSTAVPGHKTRPSPHLYGCIFVLLHLFQPRVDIVQVASELIPVGHDTNCLLLLL